MDYKDKILARVAKGLPLNGKQQLFYNEYIRLRDEEIDVGLYTNEEGVEYEIIEVDLGDETAQVKTVKSGFIKVRTLHWCRKYLSRKDN